MDNNLALTLEDLLKNTQSLKKQIESVRAQQIRKEEIKNKASDVSVCWFQKIKPSLLSLAIADEKIVSCYSDNYQKLIKYSKKSASKISYATVLRDLTKNFNNDLILPLQISPPQQQIGLNISPYLENLPLDEKRYLEEAQTCAKNDCIRASIILGWCAIIDRIHRKIEKLGFDKFNSATVEMAARDYGRFKPFNKKYKVDSLSELRTIFDTDLLWILEYLQLIDSNEHERLRHCFTMRNNSGHPGDAPITGENLYSFYSDITRIVLKNEKFTII